MIQKIISRNRKIFIRYNQFRKRMFSELAPEASETILYLLPWLLSVNDPACPGYVADIKQPFRVYNIDNDKEIMKREPEFLDKFGLKKKRTLLRPNSRYFIVQGLYTIGSVGSVSQRSLSDCDIWVCVDKKELDRKSWVQINQKINLIKDWMDMNVKIPVYFFVSDISAIKECRFGSVDSESSGSTQRNVLKEEFYRTCMIICGKIPLWWLCYDKEIRIDYNDALSAVADEDFWEYDIIDFGDIEQIGQEEYFGAALWQFHKSLSSPLKSIIKLILLQMLLDAPQQRLLCHQFREEVMSTEGNALFPDHSIFTITSILRNYKETKKDMLTFLIDCFFIRSEINTYNKRQKLKNMLVADFLKEYPVDRERRAALKASVSWGFRSQIKLGDQLFKLLIQIYREISAAHTGIEGKIDTRDITILGRKISAYYLKKRHKIPVLQKPTGTLNISDLTLELKDNVWSIYPGSDRISPLVSNKNIIFNIAFIVWNNLFVSNAIHMRPNASSVTLQEVINVGKKIANFFGTYDTLDIELYDYLKQEIVTKLLVVLDFEKSPWYQQTKDFIVVYMNCWGELFTRHFGSMGRFEEFFGENLKVRKDIELSYYVQRNSTVYEKIIARAKRVILSSIET